MRFRIDRDALVETVTWAARALPARSPVPVLGGLLLDVRGDRLRISGFDYEVSARIEVPAQVGEPGSTLVMGRRLVDVCRVLPDEPVECVVAHSRLELACAGLRFGLSSLPQDDYPALPPLPESCGAVDAAEFAAAVAQVAVAAGRDGTLPVLTGVRMDLAGDTMTLAATDRYRFAVRTLRWKPESSGVSADVVVPARWLADTTRSMAGAGMVRVALDGGSIGLEGSAMRGTTRLIDGRLPRHDKLLELGESSVAVAGRQALLDAVKRVAVVTDRDSPVRLAFSAHSVLVEAGDGHDDVASQRLPATLRGADGVTVAFNPAFLIDALAALDAPRVRFDLLGPGQRSLLTGRPEQDAPAGTADPSYRHLLMSVRTLV